MSNPKDKAMMVNLIGAQGHKCNTQTPELEFRYSGEITSLHGPKYRALTNAVHFFKSNNAYIHLLYRDALLPNNRDASGSFLQSLNIFFEGKGSPAAPPAVLNN